VFELIVTILGIGASALYVGYLAFAIKSIPLWVIVIATFALVVREFVVEFRSEAAPAPKEPGDKSSG
jgi:type III secretory pathway component EscT